MQTAPLMKLYIVSLYMVPMLFPCESRVVLWTLTISDTLLKVQIKRRHGLYASESCAEFRIVCKHCVYEADRMNRIEWCCKLQYSQGGSLADGEKHERI